MATDDKSTAALPAGKPAKEYPPRALSSRESIIEGVDWSRDKKLHFESQVAEATLMLDFAISGGPSVAEGRKIDDEILAKITKAQDLCAQADLPPAEARAEFEGAYRDLSTTISPVTAETLKATSENYAIHSFLFTWISGPRPIAIIWSRKLSAWTLAIVAVALVGSYLDQANGPIPVIGDRPIIDDHVKPLTFVQSLQMACQLLLPFTYGAIGACVALLKSCQEFIYKRQFDPRHIPEYYNRMILGAVSGGMIVILITQVTGDDGTEIKLSAAALGFIAGYNSDLLFAAIERISTAILPRVGLSSIQQQPKPPVAIDDVSMKDVLNLHHKADNPKDKKVYSDLIEKMKDRL